MGEAEGPEAMPTILMGKKPVSVLRRDWQSGPREPYRKTYALQPGQHWSEAELTPDQWEHYVARPGKPQVPVGALIAAELIETGAEVAAFIELWGGRCVLVGPDLYCMAPDGPLGAVVEEIQRANDGRLGGLPDVIGVFPDGRVAGREAKNVSAGDRLGAKQHAMADLLRELYGERLDLAVVEWGIPQ